LGNLSNNLLAFSGGVDSSALFFMLLNKIDFDIAIVNYHTRKQSQKEIEYAKYLAKKYDKKIYIKDCLLEKNNFEANARKCRYEFFEELSQKYGYQNLYLAHQLNDKFEWFLMQLSKGAGLKELLGMKKKEKRKYFTIHRPLLDYSREEILEYLHQNNIKYFIDSSNEDTKYKRNYFRKHFATKFVSEFKNGLKKSFCYLEEDRQILFQKDWQKQNLLYKFPISTPKIDIKKVDLILKELGYVLSSAQRNEIIKQNFSTIIANKFAIDNNQKEIFISPFIKIKMDKKSKEKMRINKIPPKIRGYYLSSSISI
jgi:tRNA(Ile)-lysidine synthase